MPLNAPRPILAMVMLAAMAGGSPVVADPALRQEALGLFEPIPLQPDPAPDPAAVDLGKALFFEPRLSEAHNISCNTCHNLGTGGVDLSPLSLGHRWQKGGRNSPTVFNATFNSAQFWDGRATDLTEQAGGPMVNPVEMGSTAEHVVEQIKGIPGYLPLFAAAFPGDPNPLSFANAEAAIAAFEQTLITPNAPFDRFLRGDDMAMTAEQQGGLRVFIDQGCAACHNGINLGGNSYQPFGVVEKPDRTILPAGDKGRFAVTRADEDAYVFKVPTLRNVAITPPYFHSGSVWDLSLAVGVMGSAQLGAKLDPGQETSIVAFLGSLTGELPPILYPILPPGDASTPRPMQ